MATGTEDYAYGNQCVSNMLSNYFTNVGINLATKTSKPVQCNFNLTSLMHSNINCIFIQSIAEDEISRGGVLEDVLGLEDTCSSPWPWPRSLKSSKIALSSARGQHYFLNG